MPTNHWPTCNSNRWERGYRIGQWAATAAILVTLLGLCASVAANPVGITRLPDASQAVPSDDSLYFAAGSANLDTEANLVLQRHAAKLRAHPGLQVTIVAHTDDLGSASLELVRSQLRLDAVRQYLEAANIAPARVRTLNHGSEAGGSSICDDDACRRTRRRVDFLFHH